LGSFIAALSVCAILNELYIDNYQVTILNPYNISDYYNTGSFLTAGIAGIIVSICNFIHFFLVVKEEFHIRYFQK
jgi:hypothetical protein